MFEFFFRENDRQKYQKFWKSNSNLKIFSEHVLFFLRRSKQFCMSKFAFKKFQISRAIKNSSHRQKTNDLKDNEFLIWNSQMATCSLLKTVELINSMTYAKYHLFATTSNCSCILNYRFGDNYQHQRYWLSATDTVMFA